MAHTSIRVITTTTPPTGPRSAQLLAPDIRCERWHRRYGTQVLERVLNFLVEPCTDLWSSGVERL